ncbi:GGDEF domain-containing protein [Oricola nitratireducens]|uniref:GGDEF domain-containing protein n=1 Tax=Oricola nitratireducens TaxID=2775868 RepID=UPI001866A7F0|nr:diguanylate cyclase [Oricola nitratireducens]
MKKLYRKLFGASAAVENPGPVDFKALTEHSGDLIVQVGQDFKLRYVSPSAKAILGWTPEEMLHQQVNLLNSDDRPRIEASMLRLVAGAPREQISFRVKRKDGDWAWMEGSASIIRDAESSGDMVVVMRDISERKRMEEELGELAFRDKLTGIANRRKFDEVLENEWQRCLRSQGHMSLLLLDIDHFKGVNDRYGHQVGDDCLRSVAQTVQSLISRPADLVARYGGEEIGVVLPDTDQEGALQIAETLRQSVQALRIPNQDNHEGSGVVTVSIGVATAFSRVGGRIAMPEGLLMAVDHALYQAKHEGRNRVASSMLLMSAGEGNSSASAG